MICDEWSGRWRVQNPSSCNCVWLFRKMEERLILSKSSKLGRVWFKLIYHSILLLLIHRCFISCCFEMLARMNKQYTIYTVILYLLYSISYDRMWSITLPVGLLIISLGPQPIFSSFPSNTNKLTVKNVTRNIVTILDSWIFVS